MRFLLEVVSSPKYDTTRATDLSGIGDSPLISKKSPTPPPIWKKFSSLTICNIPVASDSILSSQNKTSKGYITVSTNCTHDNNPITNSTYPKPVIPGLGNIGHRVKNYVR